MDHESLGVCTTGVFSVMLHWAKTARAPEENWSSGRLGKFQGTSIPFVRNRDVFCKFPISKQATARLWENRHSGASTLPFTILDPLHGILSTSHIRSPSTFS